MAEYIKLDAIMEYCQNQKDKTINCNDLARFPTADVIERSKIDKAIEEIEQVKSVMNEEIIEHDRKDLINFINGINQCLIILKENIGE